MRSPLSVLHFLHPHSKERNGQLHVAFIQRVGQDKYGWHSTKTLTNTYLLDANGGYRETDGLQFLLGLGNVLGNLLEQVQEPLTNPIGIPSERGKKEPHRTAVKLNPKEVENKSDK